VERLRALAVEVERETELVSFEDNGASVPARVRTPDRGERTIEARYLAGCDGARSPVRHALGDSFESGTYRQVFYVGGVELSRLEPAGEAHIALDAADFVAVLSYGEGRSRLIGAVRDEEAARAEELEFDDMDLLAKVTIGLGPAIYNPDSAVVSGAQASEIETIRANFLVRKLGLPDGPELRAGIERAIETYGTANRNKHRAVIYYLLTKHFGREAAYA
jgi:2-polyprenyl-6-methoxyphenol hydroxylase-like FAD-dependent oxidoreductase